MGRLLVNLQVRKSVADGEGAREFYEKLTTPRAGWAGEIRYVGASSRPCKRGIPGSRLTGNHSDIVLAKKQPRKVFVQPNTFVADGKVELKEYPLTNEGVIQSFVERCL